MKWLKLKAMKIHFDGVGFTSISFDFGLVVNLHLWQTYEYSVTQQSLGKVWEKVCFALRSLCSTSQQDAFVVRRRGDKKFWRFVL